MSEKRKVLALGEIALVHKMSSIAAAAAGALGPAFSSLEATGMKFNRHFFVPEYVPKPGLSYIWSFETCLNLK